MRRSSVLAAFLVLVVLLLARSIDAATDPAVPACEQAVAAGYYTSELFGQCLDDYREVDSE